MLALVTLSWSSGSTNKQPIPSANYYKIEGLVAGESFSGPSDEGTNFKISSSYAKVNSAIYDSGSVYRRTIFFPRETSPL